MLIRAAGRILGRQPAASLVAMAALIAGIGVAGAVAGFLASLNTPPRWTARAAAPHALVRVRPVRNYGSYTAIARRLETLDAAVYLRVPASLGRGRFAAPLRLECVSGSYWEVLGVQPFAGRSFDPRDDVEGGPPVVLLAHHFWLRRFEGDLAALGATLRIDDRRHTIIGVAPPDFGGVDAPPADAWTPLAASPTFCSASGRPILDQGAWLQAVGRVRPGFTAAHADAEVAARFPVEAEAERRFGRGVVEPLYGGRAAWESPAGRIGRWLAAGVGFLLLVVCVNVSSLRSLQVADRREALAVRRRLGATRLRLGGALWVETLLLAALCAPPAVIVALWTAWTLEAFFPLGSAEAVLSPRGLAGLTAAALAVGGLAGAAPAVAGARTALRSVPGESMPAAARPSLGRDALLASQVAAVLVLIMVAQLFVRSTAELRSGLGFDLDGVAVLTADLERAGFGSADVRSTFDLLAERVVRLPDVEAAALASRSLLSPDESTPMRGVMAPGSSGSVPAAAVNAVSPSYFDVVGTRLVHGRAFTREDAAGSRPVMIVSDGLARRLWPGRDATRRCAFVGNAGCVEVVGVSESRRHRSVQDYEEEFFVPLAQDLPLRSGRPSRALRSPARHRGRRPGDHRGRGSRRAAGPAFRIRGAALRPGRRRDAVLAPRGPHVPPVRRRRRAAGRHRRLRIAGLDRASAHTGNRRPDGARRPALGRRAMDAAPRRGGARGGRGARRRRDSRRDSAAAGVAVRRGPDGRTVVRRRLRRGGGQRVAGGRRAGRAGDAGGSAGGAAKLTPCLTRSATPYFLRKPLY